ncbi:hypothetical protein ACIG3E_09635 [Streptomyces sp. NPDC053474]|uniref:hypothetical protein n=1 Tax=Streptomyces sp. NPDC053474 TaxID=3365704 RepID=UPI0037CE76CA
MTKFVTPLPTRENARIEKAAYVGLSSIDPGRNSGPPIALSRIESSSVRTPLGTIAARGAGMADLGVDYTYLYTIKNDLRTVRREFKGCSAHQSDLSNAYGSPDVSGAMEEFTSNWDDHRKELLQSIEKVGKLVERSIESFEKVDQELTKPGKKKLGRA